MIADGVVVKYEVSRLLDGHTECGWVWTTQRELWYFGISLPGGRPNFSAYCVSQYSPLSFSIISFGSQDLDTPAMEKTILVIASRTPSDRIP